MDEDTETRVRGCLTRLPLVVVAIIVAILELWTESDLIELGPR